jgi:hypothetical protein
MHQDDVSVVMGELLGAQHGAQVGRRTGISLGAGHVLVGDEPGLHHEASWSIDGLDVIEHGSHRPLHERDEADRGDAYPLARGGHPVGTASQDAGAEVQHPLVATQPTRAHVEGLVVDQQADDLSVRHVDHRLPRFRIAVAALRVRKRALFVEAIEIAAR